MRFGSGSIEYEQMIAGHGRWIWRVNKAEAVESFGLDVALRQGRSTNQWRKGLVARRGELMMPSDGPCLSLYPVTA